MSAERLHHPFSPSTLQARESCPKYQPAQGNSAAAEAGTRQHDAVERGEDSEHLDDNQAFAVAECLAYADKIAEKYPGGRILKEEYFPIDDEVITVPTPDPAVVQDFVGTTAGYPDFVIISKDETVAEILDWKFGKQPVEDTANNLQGIAYMLGVKRRFPTVQTCTVHFVCPHQDTVDRHTFRLTDETKDALYLRVKVIVSRARQAAGSSSFDMARPSTSACLFCALVGKCPKVTELVLNIGKKFSPMEIPETVSPTMVSDPVDASIGLRVAQVVIAWAEGYRAQVTQRAATHPTFMPAGYRLIPMQRREVISATAVADIAKQMLPESAHAAVEALYDIPITKVADLVKLATPRGKKTAAVQAFDDALDASGATKLGKEFYVLRMSAE